MSVQQARQAAAEVIARSTLDAKASIALRTTLGALWVEYEANHLPTLSQSKVPRLNWSTVMFRKRRTENGKQATQARGNSSEATVG